MEAIGCLVPEFRSEKRRGHGKQLFEKMQCFYIATYLRILSCYVKLTRVLVKSIDRGGGRGIGNGSESRDFSALQVYSARHVL